jgi:hypothetical protein
MAVTIRFPRIQEQLSKAEAKAKEPWGLLDPNWDYVPSAATEVRNTWRKFGWTPPSENKQEKQDETICPKN